MTQSTTYANVDTNAASAGVDTQHGNLHVG